MRDRMLAVNAWAVMNSLSVSLAVVGFERTTRFVLDRAPKRRVSDQRGVVDNDARQRVSVRNDARHDPVDRIVQAIGQAKRWHVRMTPDDCLPVALTGVWLLRQFGVDADLVLGVTRYPFAAHAWVAAGDRVVDFPANKHKNFIGVAMTRREQGRPC